MELIRRTWSFGALRKVVVNTDPAAWEELDYLLAIEAVQALLAGRAVRFIGEADRVTPLVLLGDAPTVYALFVAGKHAIFPVAAGLATMTSFLNDVASLWSGHEQRYTLDTTAYNVALAQLMLEEFEVANPGCDAGFWEHHCLAGLNWGIPLAVQ
jgi:hypothetical protein